MLNILKNKQNTYNDNSLNSLTNKEKNKLQDKLDKNEYKNIIYYPSSSKEWFSSIYSYNNSYIKSLISLDSLANTLFLNYFNMLGDKIRFTFKRRRPNKIRYSGNKIFISRAEFKHTNAKLTILLYAYNKQKLSIEKYLTRVTTLKVVKEIMGPKGIQKITKYKNNRLALLLKKRFFFLKNEQIIS